MSAKTEVVIKCDKCGNSSISPDGSYIRPHWYKINIEEWNYDAKGYRDSSRHNFDYCDSCVDAYGKSSLLLQAANGSIK